MYVSNLNCMYKPGAEARVQRSPALQFETNLGNTVSLLSQKRKPETKQLSKTATINVDAL